ncbi:probable E3 ubiquitin-protein ligase ATL44 [Lolium rigidum]|uniref:probable E3 ubiquitin-protein ligase ATL44 n=1 Tax=Lolium rigidum TaxID=89674 RepID=UPI001F5DB740|nr:probable E3 ubiquitin-protein ligase ATL44 [Lolium rigidum]
MRAPASLLLHRTAAGETSSSMAPRSTPEQHQQQTAPAGMAVDSNMVVILASLLCALVCVLGLALVSRCACRRRRTSSSDHSPPPPKGLRKKAIDALPTVLFAISPDSSSTSAPSTTAWCLASECAICLTEFADGESVRVLPGCGHGFHGACVDAWLRTSASCPSCRAAISGAEPARRTAPVEPTVVVVVASGGSRCGRCGELAAPAGSGAGDCTFLP